MNASLPQDCVICRYFGLEPRHTSNSLGIRTSIGELITASTSRLDDGASDEAHIFVPVCPEHVVDIYRDRVPGVNMAWRMAGAAT